MIIKKYSIVSLAYLIFFLCITFIYADQNDRIIFNHPFHLNDIDLSCEECHDQTPLTNEKSWDIFPDMDLCLTCHDGDTADDDCEKCHTNPDEPLTVSDYWIKTNKDFSHNNHINFISDCLKCHYYLQDEEVIEQKLWSESDCNSCHSKHEYVDNLTTCVSCHTDFHVGNNGQDCQVCHNTNSWFLINTVDIHQYSRFPLVGPHIYADCEECHTSGSLLEFPPLNVDCFSCHAQDYLSTQVPSHVTNNLSRDCEDCHAITGPTWDLGFTNHSFFPLIGGHGFAECSDCHSQKSFQNINTGCYDCHQSDYSSTIDPNHISLDFSTNCEECHTINPGWYPISIDHDIFFVLTGAHVNIKNECNSCHLNGYNNTSNECYSCHQSDYSATIDPNHISLDFSTDCEECHTTNSGWNPVNIDHNVFYPLIGGHNSVKNDCSNCHTQGYNNTTDYCFNCHSTDYSSSIDPNHTQYQFPQDCEMCHTPNPNWTPTIFDHNTVFPLLGGHALIKTDCIHCHSTGFNNILTECVDCHLADYNGTTDPDHSSAQFPQDCDQCHTTNPGWTPVTIDHSIFFPLLGGHNLVKDDCTRCHSSGYTNTSTECVDCHLADYNGTTDPDHSSAQFPQDCDQCHTTNPGWTPVTIDHSIFFPLLGGHNLVKDDCTRCHSSGYTNTSTECVSCHLADYNGTTDPDHSAAQFPQDCDQCHTTNPGWTPATFDHNAFFPLLGGHDLVKDDCLQCHSSGYDNTSTECVSCHLADYNGTTDPDHSAAQFPQDCDQCHTTNPGWTPATFDHNVFFPLLGGHDLVKDDCLQCHSSGYDNTSTECVSCHLADYNGTTDPDHSAAQFPQDCDQCHTTNPGWTPATFDHNAFFPLLGGHDLVKDDCLQCHSSGYDNTSTECVSCHLADYNGTTDPDHSAAQFPQDCDQCHTTNPGWTPATFDHNAFFPLLGGHDLVKDDCLQCHSSGYDNTSTECVSCHLADYNGTTDPDHSAAQFPQDCDQCHTTNPGWTPATFDHNAFFPLLGGHDLVKDDCLQCHSSGYDNTSTECVSCHLADYNGTTDPDHSAAQFPQDCDQCHTTNPGWTPATFDHNAFFPLLGGHDLVKDDCLQCHSSGYDNTSTECVSCHLADYNGTTDPDHSAAQFPQDCDQCHTTNPGWTPATFDHNAFFPLLGGHDLVKDDCLQCHSSGYDNTSTECVSCHLADYNGTTDPDHSAAQFPQDCDQCHTTNPGWTPATFDHDGLYFPIYSGEHEGDWDNCSTCHFNPSNYSEFSCFYCHSENSTRGKHIKHGSLIDGYVYDSYACYDCHPNGEE